MDIREGLTFDDVLLVPKRSPIISRSQTDLKTKLSRNITLNIPIISANMDTITESPMAIEMFKLGVLGILHRFMNVEELRRMLMDDLQALGWRERTGSR